MTLLRQVAATFCSIQSIRHDTSLKEKTDAPQENHARGTPGLGAVWAGGPGSGLTAGASLRKATLIECDPAPAVCTSLLTIEIFLTRNLGLRQARKASRLPTRGPCAGYSRPAGTNHDRRPGQPRSGDSHGRKGSGPAESCVRSWGVRSLTMPPDRRTIAPITAQVRLVISSRYAPRPRASCPFVRGLLFGCVRASPKNAVGAFSYAWAALVPVAARGVPPAAVRP